MPKISKHSPHSAVLSTSLGPGPVPKSVACHNFFELELEFATMAEMTADGESESWINQKTNVERIFEAFLA